MHLTRTAVGLSAALFTLPLLAQVQLGPRPYFPVDDMEEGWLKSTLQSRAEAPFQKTDFLGHRSAAAPLNTNIIPP